MNCLLNRTRISAAGAIVALMWLLASTTPSQAQSLPADLEDVTEAEIPTVGGKLEIHRLSFTQEDGLSKLLFQITLNGKVVHRVQYSILPGAQGYPQEGPARFVLLELTTGGSGCPARYRVLEAKDDGHAVVSQEFGNCSNQARASITQGVLRIHLPKAGGAAAESWSYQKGKLSKDRSPQRR